MVPQTLTSPSESQATSSVDVAHMICPVCYPDDNDPLAVAICGRPMNDSTHWCPPDMSCGCVDCVVCAELDEEPCERCGY